MTYTIKQIASILKTQKYKVMDLIYSDKLFSHKSRGCYVVSQDYFSWWLRNKRMDI